MLVSIVQVARVIKNELGVLKGLVPAVQVGEADQELSNLKVLVSIVQVARVIKNELGVLKGLVPAVQVGEADQELSNLKVLVPTFQVPGADQQLCLRGYVVSGS